MQKLVLLDEFDKEYKRLQRPAAAVAKVDRSLALSKTLNDASIADDRKVREYIDRLHRYLNVDKTTKEPIAEINWISEPAPVTPRQAPRRQLETSGSSTQQARKKKKGKRKAQPAAIRLQWDQYGPAPTRR